MSSYFANIPPFQTERFEKDYSNVTQSGENASIVADSKHKDCPRFETTLNNGEKHIAALFYTNYVAINKDNAEVYITEYKRKLDRKINGHRNEEQHVRKLTNCGGEVLSTINRVLQRYPLDKNFDYWIELHADGSNDEIPLLVLYVEQKTKLVSINEFSQRYALPYKVKRRIFVDVLSMALNLLHYQLFTELIMMYNFCLRLDADDEISSAMSTSALFDVIFRFVFNFDDDYQNIVLTSRKGLQRMFLHQPFYMVMQNVMLWLFEKESGHEWRHREEDLPREMYMIYLRFSNDIKIYRGSALKTIVKELQFPYEKSRIECFERLELLGSGSFGDVHLARHKSSGVKYAIKVIKNYNQSQKTTEKLFETLMLATKFDHKNIVKYYDAWTSNDHSNWIAQNSIEDTDHMTSSEMNESKTSTSYYTANSNLKNTSAESNRQDSEWNCKDRYTFIVLQACRSSLHSFMQKETLTEGQCIRYMKEFINGLEYLNSLGFMHRDVKPQNALISKNGSLLIADLDTIKRIKQSDDGESIQHTLVKTPAYVSPEMSTKKYNERIDYYSIGITFAQMICPEQCTDKKAFLSLIHKDRLPQNLHPQYAFIIRWLTEEDPTDRIGFLSFSSLLSLLERHKYPNWAPRAFNSYSMMIEHQETEEIIKCLRVVNSKATIREIVKRYSRQVEYGGSKTNPMKLRLRIEPAFAFEINCQLSFTGQEQSCIELIDDRLVLVNSSTDYVYVCYSVILALEDELSPEGFVDYIRLLIRDSFDIFTKWGSYSFAHFSRCPFYQDCFIIEPCMLDVVSAEYIQTQRAQFCPPEKIFGFAPMSEAGSIFSFGIYLLWNLLLALEISEDDRIITIRQLQDGIRPELLSLLEPHISQLIMWLCAHKPEDRPLKKNIPFYFESINRPPTIDKVFLFRLTYEDIEFTEELQRDGTIIKHKTESLWRRKGWSLCTTRKQNRSIYTISNRPGVMEKVMNRLKICGDFHAIPRHFVEMGYECDAPELGAVCMLDLNENGELEAVPRAPDAVDWLISESGSDYSDVEDTYNFRRFVLPFLHNTFATALLSLTEFHKNGLYHGNINFGTFLLDERGSFCLANPILVQENTDFCSKSAYITEYSSPEQKESLQGSPESDVFSLGVTLFALLCHYHDVIEINLNQFQNERELRFPGAIESEYCDLIRQMTQAEPTERIDCCQALKIFNSTCAHYLDEAKNPKSKLYVDSTNKTEYQLQQLISK